MRLARHEVPLQDLADPILTASIYRSGALDEVIHRVIAPFRNELVATTHWMWVLRYNRCGEHLKVRLHGSPNERDELANLFESGVRCYLAGAEPIAAQRMNRLDAPPIDLEDQGTGSHQDTTFLWTTYRRSPVSFGGKPFLLDDTYAVLVARCLARGLDLALLALQPDAGGCFEYKPRQASLLKALLAGLSPVKSRSAYLTYHRDWLLRAFLARNWKNLDDADQLLAKLELRAASARESIAILRQVAQAKWNRVAANDLETPEAAWQEAISNLLQYVARFGDDPEFHLDPFAAEPCFPVLFKAFNGLSNQLGLDPLNEAYTYHLLLHAIEGVIPGLGISLTPELKR